MNTNSNASKEQPLYATTENGFFYIRQERYRARRLEGVEHPQDIMAVARSAEELRSMADKYLSNVDYSALQLSDPPPA